MTLYLKTKSLLLIALFSLSLSIFSTKCFASQRIEDPDLKLSIEELKKKYPIEIITKKYGEANDVNCDDGDDQPNLAMIVSWPCGAFCAKYPEKQNCPEQCHNHKKSLPKNLVCSFSTGYSLTKNDAGQSISIRKPKARFEDFSISEIKSAFIDYNFSKNPLCHLHTEINECEREYEIITITFMYFCGKSDASLTAEEKVLRTFFFSEKINPAIKNIDNKCSYFLKFS